MITRDRIILLPHMHTHAAESDNYNYKLLLYLEIGNSVRCMRKVTIGSSMYDGCGVKFTTDSLSFAAIVRCSGTGLYRSCWQVNTIVFHINMFLCGLCSTYNYTGKLNNRLLAAVRRNDMETAQLEQRRSQAVITLLEKYGQLCISVCVVCSPYHTCSHHTITAILCKAIEFLCCSPVHVSMHTV